MASLPYMQFYPGDYHADTQHLSTVEHGAYFLLILNYWQTGKALPDNNERLAIIAKLSLDEWIIIRPVLSEFFEVKGGKWFHYRIEADLDKVEQKSKQARNAGKESAKRRIRENLKAKIKDSTDVITDVAAENQRNGNHIDIDTDKESDTDIENNTPPDEIPHVQDSNGKNDQVFHLNDTTVERLHQLAFWYNEFGTVKHGKPVEDHIWQAGQVLKYQAKNLINGKPFMEALELSLHNLQGQDWFHSAGGLLWLLDVKAGKYNGEEASIRIAKYMNGPPGKGKALSSEDRIRKKVAALNLTEKST